MNEILNRDEFIMFKFSDGLNEGLFDIFKSIFKQDWNSVKGSNSSLKKTLENIDNQFSGYKLMKLKNANTCSKVRQALYNYADTLMRAEGDKIENAKHVEDAIKSMSQKGEADSDNKEKVENALEVQDYADKYGIKNKVYTKKLENLEKALKEACNNIPEVKKWAGEMKNAISDYIFELVLKALESDGDLSKKAEEAAEDARKKAEERQLEDEKEREEASKKYQKETNDKIKKIINDRHKVLSKLGISPENGTDGEKTLNKMITSFNNDIYNSFNKLKLIIKNMNENLNNIIEETKSKKGLSDKCKDFLDNNTESLKEFGIDGEKIIDVLSNETTNRANFKLKIMFKEIKVIFDALNDFDNNLFKGVANDSIQAMLAGICNIVQCGVTGEKISDDVLELLSRCSISSDQTIGYGIPIVDGDNLFVKIMEQFSDESKFKDKHGVFNKFEKDKIKFIERMKIIFEDIKKKSKEIKDESKKEE